MFGYQECGCSGCSEEMCAYDELCPACQAAGCSKGRGCRRGRVERVAGAVLQTDLPPGDAADVVVAPGPDGSFRVGVSGLTGAEAIVVADFAERLVRTRGTPTRPAGAGVPTATGEASGRRGLGHRHRGGRPGRS